MKKRIVLALTTLSLLGCLTGCTYNAELEAEKEYTAELKEQISSSIGKPNLTNWFEYAQLKEIYEMRDNPNLICYWYTKNDYTGKWIYQGKCVGYGIPYGASITSNEYPGYGEYRYGDASQGQVKQAEPNGLYTDSVVTTATWILSVDESGNITPTYVESEISISQVKIDASRCEDWSLSSDYPSLPDEAEIDGEVNTDDLNLGEEVSTEVEEIDE